MTSCSARAVASWRPAYRSPSTLNALRAWRRSSGDRLVVQDGVAGLQVLRGLEADRVELVERAGVGVHRQLGRDRLVADARPAAPGGRGRCGDVPSAGRCVRARSGRSPGTGCRHAGALLLRGERARAGSGGGPRCSPGTARDPREAASSARSAGTMIMIAPTVIGADQARSARRRRPTGCRGWCRETMSELDAAHDRHQDHRHRRPRPGESAPGSAGPRW